MSLKVEENYMPSAPPSYNEAVGINPSVHPHVPPGAVSSVPVGFGQPQSIAYPPPISTPTVTHVNVGPSKARLRCPQCSKNIQTSVETSFQKGAHLACFLLCLFGCFLCSCIPYCLNSFKDVHHKCPECKAYIGTYKH